MASAEGFISHNALIILGKTVIEDRKMEKTGFSRVSSYKAAFMQSCIHDNNL